MAKVKETQPLKMGRRNVSVIGKVHLPKDGFAEPEMKEGSQWLGVRTGFSVETEEGNLVYCSISGGRSMRTGVLYAQSNQEGGGSIQIPFADRDNKELLDKVADYSFLKANLGKEEYKTIDTLDFVEYLRDNLENGAEVYVKGVAEYSEYEKNGETNIYRNFNVQNIFLNEEVEDDKGNTIWKYPKTAVLKQTYLFNSDSLDKRYAKELEEEGKTIVKAFVPQYMSTIKSPTGKYVEFKKCLPLPQPIVYRVPENERDQVDKHVKMLDRLYGCKRDEILEQDVIVAIKEGYVSEGGEIEITKEMQGLIDEGLISIEDIQKAPTVRSTRRSELEYLKIALMINEDNEQGLGSKDKYTSEIFVRPSFDEDDEDDVVGSFKEDKANSTSNKSVVTFDDSSDDEEEDGLIDFDALFD